MRGRRSAEGRQLRLGLLKGAVLVFVAAGYSGKRFVFEKARELGVRSVIIDGPDSWSQVGGRAGRAGDPAQPTSLRAGRQCICPAAARCCLARRSASLHRAQGALSVLHLALAHDILLYSACRARGKSISCELGWLPVPAGPGGGGRGGAICGAGHERCRDRVQQLPRGLRGGQAGAPGSPRCGTEWAGSARCWQAACMSSAGTCNACMLSFCHAHLHIEGRRHRAPHAHGGHNGLSAAVRAQELGGLDGVLSFCEMAQPLVARLCERLGLPGGCGGGGREAVLSGCTPGV